MQDSKRYINVSENCLYDKIDDIAYTPHPTTNQWIPLVPNQTTLALEVYASSCIALKSIVVLNDNQITVGRDRCQDGNRLRLDDMEVSRFHGIIYKEPFEVLVEEDPYTQDKLFTTIEDTQQQDTSTSSKTKKSSQVKSQHCTTKQDSFSDSSFVSYGHSYWIVDQGSTHAGLPQRLFNGDKIKIGKSCFNIHIHSKDKTCEGCNDRSRCINLERTGRKMDEDKLVNCLEDIGYIKSLSYKQQRNKLKRAFVGDDDYSVGFESKKNDKSKDRRTRDKNELFVDEYSRTTFPIQPEIVKPSYGKGMKMLEKMGWIGGGLGSNQQGATNIIDAPLKLNRLGVGAVKK